MLWINLSCDVFKLIFAFQKAEFQKNYIQLFKISLQESRKITSTSTIFTSAF